MPKLDLNLLQENFKTSDHSPEVIFSFPQEACAETSTVEFPGKKWLFSSDAAPGRRAIVRVQRLVLESLHPSLEVSAVGPACPTVVGFASEHSNSTPAPES